MYKSRRDDGEIVSVNSEHFSVSTAETECDSPERGLRAWLVVFGTSCTCASTVGYILTWAMFQSYYEHGPLKRLSPSIIAFIGSSQWCSMFFAGVLWQYFHGSSHSRFVYNASISVIIFANFLIAQCTQYWHFLLCQGIVLGAASGLLYASSMSILAQWFNFGFPLAFSVASCGISVGGSITPVVFRYVLNRFGFEWTVRAIATLNLALLTISFLTIKPRVQIHSRPVTQNTGDILNLPYVVYTVSTFFCFSGIYTFFVFISTRAEAVGLSSSMSIFLITICHGVSIPGRLIAFALAKKLGPLNVMIVFTIFTIISTYTWPNITSVSAVVSWTCVFGFSSAAFLALVFAPIAVLGDARTEHTRVVLQASIMVLGALIGPTVEALLVSNNGRKGANIYTGSLILVGVAGLMCTRTVVLYRSWGIGLFFFLHFWFFVI